MLKKIIVALDGSKEARKALDLAMEFAVAFSVELILAHVVSSHALSDSEQEFVQGEYQAELQDALDGSVFMGLTGVHPATAEGVIQASRELALAIRSALGRGIISRAEQEATDRRLPAVRSILRNGDPAAELLEMIVEEKPDLFVIGSRGLGRIGKLLIGSVSGKVSSAAQCTVVLVR
jgi:nucleotide-binding universal stress UspA family protein